MIRKTRGIVLHTTRYGESSLIVHCYTEQHGRQSYMVKGVRKSRKQNRSNLFQPLFILDFEVYHKDGREIQMVKEVSRSTPLNSIPFDITKSTQAIFIAEVLYRVLKEEEHNPVLSHFLISTIRYLDTLQVPSPDFHIIFMFQLARHLGFYPQNNFGESERYFDMLSGSFKSSLNRPDLQLGEAESARWSFHMSRNFENIQDSGLNSRQRKSLLEELVRFYKLHVEGMGDIRSLEVLHSFFHD